MILESNNVYCDVLTLKMLCEHVLLHIYLSKSVVDDLRYEVIDSIELYAVDSFLSILSDNCIYKPLNFEL